MENSLSAPNELSPLLLTRSGSLQKHPLPSASKKRKTSFTQTFSSNGLQPTSNGLQPVTLVAMASLSSDGMDP